MYLPDEAVASIIRSCRALRELTIEPRRSDDEVGPRSSDWKKPVPGWAAVLQHADTLRALHIEAVPPLSVFHKLGRVTLLEIALGTGAKCALRSLPPSLRALCVVSVRPDIYLYPKPAVNMKDWRWLASEVKRGAFPNFEELALDHFECDHIYACTYKLRGKIDMDVLKNSKTTWFNMDLVTSCKTADRMRTLLAMFLKLGVSCRLMNYDEVLEQAREKKRSDDEYMSEHCRYRMEEEGWLDEDAKAWKAFKKDDISSSSDDSSDEDDSNDEDDDQSGHELEDESDGSGFDSESDDYVGYGNYSRDRQNFASSLAMMRNGGYFGMG
ncbi:F-box domain protein [Colletotrichum higginsianum]|nr:F-box domain protein [Colletotrichum higginsianum]